MISLSDVIKFCQFLVESYSEEFVAYTPAITYLTKTGSFVSVEDQLKMTMRSAVRTALVSRDLWLIMAHKTPHFIARDETSDHRTVST